MFGEIAIPASGHLCDKGCTSPLAQRKKKRNRFPFTAILKLHIGHGKDITKAVKTELQTSSSTCLPPTPKTRPLCFCPSSGNNNFQAFNPPPNPSEGPGLEDGPVLWWPSRSRLCGGNQTASTATEGKARSQAVRRGCGDPYLWDADAVGLVVEPRGVVIHVSNLDVDRPFDHLRSQG